MDVKYKHMTRVALRIQQWRKKKEIEYKTSFMEFGVWTIKDSSTNSGHMMGKIKLSTELLRKHKPNQLGRKSPWTPPEENERCSHLVVFFLHSVRPLFISSPSPDNLNKCKNWRQSCWPFVAAADPFVPWSSGMVLASSVCSKLVRESTTSSCWHSLR